MYGVRDAVRDGLLGSGTKTERTPADHRTRRKLYRRPPRPTARKKRDGNRLCTRCGVRRCRHSGERRSVLARHWGGLPRTNGRPCREFVPYAKHRDQELTV